VAGAGVAATTGFGGVLAATVVGRLGAAGETWVGDLGADDRATATGALAGAACGWAVALAPMTTDAPQAGQRARFPSDPAGAFSFFPQAHRIRIDGTADADIVYHPFG
jgi:hypothetical protein